jgi:hypothetical protein
VKLNPDATAKEIENALSSSSECTYGTERTQEIGDQIRHLAEMLHVLSRRELALRDDPPHKSGATETGSAT